MTKLTELIGKPLTIKRVWVDTAGPRPALMIDVVDPQSGEVVSFELDRHSARELRHAFGPHPLVDEFFRSGQGVQ